MNDLWRLCSDSEPPADWRPATLGSVLTQKARKVRVQANCHYTRLGVRWYAEGPFTKDDALGTEIKGRNLFQVKAGDFIYNRLFAWKGSFGIVPLEMDGCYVSNEFPVFEVDRSVAEPEFLWRYFSLPPVWRFIEEKSTGSTRTSRLRYKEEDLLALRITLPSLPEQRAITHVLRTVQVVRMTAGTAVIAAQQLKQSLMQHLLKYGPVSLDQADRVTLQETDIGPMPKHWEIIPLGELARVGNGSTPKRGNPDYWDAGKLPWLTSGKIHEVIIQTADQFVTEKAKAECHLPLVKKDSILVAITGQGKTLGNAALVTFDTCVSQHLAYIQFLDDRVLPDFILFFLQGRYRHFRQVSEGGGSTKGALTCGFLKGYPVPILPIDEQRRIVKTMTSITSKLKAEEHRRDAFVSLFASLLHRLMTGQVRVHELGLPIPAEVA